MLLLVHYYKGTQFRSKLQEICLVLRSNDAEYFYYAPSYQIIFNFVIK